MKPAERTWFTNRKVDSIGRARNGGWKGRKWGAGAGRGFGRAEPKSGGSETGAHPEVGGGGDQAGRLCGGGGSIDVHLYDILAPPHPHIRVLVGLFICCYLCIYLSLGYWSGH